MGPRRGGGTLGSLLRGLAGGNGLGKMLLRVASPVRCAVRMSMHYAWVDDHARRPVQREQLVGIGMALLKRQFLSGDWATVVNGWRYPPERSTGHEAICRATPR